MSRIQIFESEQARNRFIVHSMFVGVVFVGGWMLLRRHLWQFTSLSEIQSFIRGFGVFSPIIFVLIQATQVVVAPIPGQVMGVLGGYLFGPVYGTLYSLAGITLGSAVAFWIARRFGRSYIERIVHPETLETFDDVVNDKGTVAVFVLFLVPGLPDDAVCFLAGVTSIPLRRLVVLAAVGRTPAFVLATLAGARLAEDDIGTALALLTILAVCSLGCYLFRAELIAIIERLTESD